MKSTIVKLLFLVRAQSGINHDNNVKKKKGT